MDTLSDLEFYDQIQSIESILRFECEMNVEGKTKIKVKNGTMNNIILQDCDPNHRNNKLVTACFEKVTVLLIKDDDELLESGNSSDEEETGDHEKKENGGGMWVKPYLLVHVGKYMTFAKYGHHDSFYIPKSSSSQSPSSFQSTCTSDSNHHHHLESNSHLNSKPKNEFYMTHISSNNNPISHPHHPIRIHLNKEFFMNPKRDAGDLDFRIRIHQQFEISSFECYIDHLVVLPPMECFENVSKNGHVEQKMGVVVEYNHLVLSNETDHFVVIQQPNQSDSTKSNSNWKFTNANGNGNGKENQMVGNKRSFLENHHVLEHGNTNSRSLMDDDEDSIDDYNPSDLIHDMCASATITTNKRQRLSEEFQQQQQHSMDLQSNSNSQYSSSSSQSVWSTLSRALQKVRDPCGFTLLHAAAFRGYTKLVKMLVDQHHFQVDQQDHYMFTPLHWACYSGNVDVAMFLMKKGASPTLQNIFALTAPDIAEEQNHMELWKAMDAELQRQACQVLFTLFSASKSDSSPSSSVSFAGQCAADQHQLATKGANGQASNGSPPSNGNSCQPATLIKKMPKGMDTKAQTMELFIKPSRKKRTYISFFPNELCSSPYKYDILLRIPLHFSNQFNELQFTFHLLIQGTDQQWQRVNQTDAVEVVKYLRTMFPLNYREIEWRIMFRVCSFHFHRKPFKFQVVYNSKLQQHQQIPASVREEQQHLIESAAALQAAANGATVEIPASSISALTGSREGGDLPAPADTSCLARDESGQIKKNALADDCVVFESEPFFIVARKKKKNDFFESM